MWAGLKYMNSYINSCRVSYMSHVVDLKCSTSRSGTIRGKILSCPSVLICCTVRMSGVAHTVAGLAKTKKMKTKQK